MSTLRKSIIVGISMCLTSSAYPADLNRNYREDITTASCIVDKAGHATLVGRPNADLISLLGQWPQGGQPLTDALVSALDRDPNRASELVALSRMANKKQKAAIAKALFDVNKRLQKDSPKSVTPITMAFPCADPDLRAALAALDAGNNSGDASSGGVPGRAFGIGSTGSAGAVSPN